MAIIFLVKTDAQRKEISDKQMNRIKFATATNTARFSSIAALTTAYTAKTIQDILLRTHHG